MKNILIALLLFCNTAFFSQTSQIENIIIITTDGLRWQEVFKGMDSVIARNSCFNQKDEKGIFNKYWAGTENERRKKLLPFIWTTMASKGQVYGNRLYNNKVDNSNPYWFSYPGYSEIFCGFVDSAINTNEYPINPNTNVLEFINQQNSFNGKVAAFCVWDAFERILSEERSGFQVICGKEYCGENNPDAEQQIINLIKKDSYKPFGEEYLDVFTHYMAIDYLKKKKPRVMYISYGETDSWAHAGRYKDYLNAAHLVDQWLGDIWNWLQSDPLYKDKTALFITVDHGRGDVKKRKWTSHNKKIADSNQIWFAVIGPGISAKGEVKTSMQILQKQFAGTFAQLLGLDFKCEHEVAKGFLEILVK